MRTRHNTALVLRKSSQTKKVPLCAPGRKHVKARFIRPILPIAPNATFDVKNGPNSYAIGTHILAFEFIAGLSKFKPLPVWVAEKQQQMCRRIVSVPRR